MFLGGDNYILKSVLAVRINAMYIDLGDLRDADNAMGMCELWDG